MEPQSLISKSGIKMLLRVFFSFLLTWGVANSAYSQDTEEGWTAPKSADAYMNPLANSQPTANAVQLFQSYCAPCHGDKGRGDGPVSTSLNPPPFNLMKQKVDNETDGALFWRITNGHRSMPTFKNTLTEMQRWQIITYIRLLQREANDEKKQKGKK